MVSEDEREHNLRTDKREEQGREGTRESSPRPARDRTRDPALFVPGTLILWSDGWFGVERGHGGASRSPPSTIPRVQPSVFSLGSFCLVYFAFFVGTYLG